jgi:MFS-type transporter involved in bile tolerance (Atg22 family)
MRQARSDYKTITLRRGPVGGGLLMGFFSQITRRSNVGVLSLIVLFVVGAVVLTRVKDTA